MTDLNVAVVGSGPSGLYAADALVKQAAKLDPPATVQVDVIDRLPTPYGLVRYGVAPDHPSIKSIAEVLRKVLEHPQVRFLGGVHLGDDVTREDLLASYDAVIYATGGSSLAACLTSASAAYRPDGPEPTTATFRSAMARGLLMFMTGFGVRARASAGPPPR